MASRIVTPSFRLARVERTEARENSDALGLLVDQIASHEDYYPGISKWLDKKVVPGLRVGDRVGYVGFENDQPIVAAVLKRGRNAKFCHVSIEDGFRSNKYGTLLFSLMAAEVRHIASEIHFTLPQGLWDRERRFFQSFGFTEAHAVRQQYRLFEDELRCSAPFERVWQGVKARLPALLTASSISGYGINDGVVLSIREPNARAIMEGRKSIELRRRFSPRWSGCRASVYAAGGPCALVGEVIIDDVVRGTPQEVWERFHEGLECTFEDFTAYVGDRDEVFALELSQPRPYASPIPLTQLSQLIGKHLSPPQSYCSSEGSPAWADALTVAALLHCDWHSASSFRKTIGVSTTAGLFSTAEQDREAIQYALEL